MDCGGGIPENLPPMENRRVIQRLDIPQKSYSADFFYDLSQTIHAITQPTIMVFSDLKDPDPALFLDLLKDRDERKRLMDGMQVVCQAIQRAPFPMVMVLKGTFPSFALDLLFTIPLAMYHSPEQFIWSWQGIPLPPLTAHLPTWWENLGWENFVWVVQKESFTPILKLKHLIQAPSHLLIPMAYSYLEKKKGLPRTRKSLRFPKKATPFPPWHKHYQAWRKAFPEGESWHSLLLSLWDGERFIPYFQGQKELQDFNTFTPLADKKPLLLVKTLPYMQSFAARALQKGFSLTFVEEKREKLTHLHQKLKPEPGRWLGFTEVWGVKRYGFRFAPHPLDEEQTTLIVPALTMPSGPDVGVNLLYPVAEILVHSRTSKVFRHTLASLFFTLGYTPYIFSRVATPVLYRILLTYCLAAFQEIYQGIPFQALDEALRALKIKRPPFYLMDGLGIPFFVTLAKGWLHHYPGTIPEVMGLSTMVKEGWLGRHQGVGFYRYGRRAFKENKKLYHRLGIKSLREKDRETLQERLLFLVINTCARILQENPTLPAPHLNHMVSLLLGLPPTWGGLLRWADDQGLPYILGKLQHWVEDHGSLYAPATLLYHAIEEKISLMEVNQ